MKYKQIHWFEAKQLDRVTNFSTEIEVIKAAIKAEVPMKYYCTFKTKKVYFGLEDHISYLGRFKNKYIKALEFPILVTLKSLMLVIFGSNRVIIVNQDLVKHVLPAKFLNKCLRKKNRFVIDIRTTPTNPDTFESDMKRFHVMFGKAVNHFDGLSFITPFMEQHVMSHYSTSLPTVNWSSGVDVNVFDFERIKANENKDPRFTIFYHGGISESRGNLNLIKACEILVNAGYQIKLTQIGIVVDKSIIDYIKVNKNENWCELLPPEDLLKMPQYIANSDLPVLPFPNFMAWRVSSPIKLMEYLAMGKKVLAPNIEAFTDVFGKNEDIVFYFDAYNKNDVEEMANKIKEIVDNKLLQNHDSLALVEFVKNNYTWEKQANNLLEFCQNL